MCKGLRKTKDRTEGAVLRAVARQAIAFAEQCGYATDKEAQQSVRPSRLNVDDTFDELKEACDSRQAGSMRTSSNFDQLPFVMSTGPPKLELHNAVIVAMRINVGTKLSDPYYVYPEATLIVIANPHGRPLAVYNGYLRGNKFVCSGRELF